VTRNLKENNVVIVQSSKNLIKKKLAGEDMV